MKHQLRIPFLIATLVLSLASQTMAQEGGGHTLFGDFKIDGYKEDANRPQSFHIILFNTDLGRILYRHTVNNNGRYRFFNVVNGSYVVIVEMENQEVARLDMVIGERVKTDIRRDIVLQWKGDPKAGTATKAGTTSVADLYERPQENKPLFEKAQEAVRKDDNDQAIALLRQIVSADPKDFEAWTELGTAYFKQKKSGDAEKAYAKALEQRPAYIVALLNLGKLQVSQKKFENAITTLTQAVATQPQSADANYWLGEAYLQVKKGSKAVGYLNEAIKLDPAGMAEVHLRLAALYNGAGLKDRAAVEYEQFLAKKPDYPDKKKLEEYIKENKKN